MRILILGCGWVGEAFAFYMKSLGHEIWASTTSLEKCRRLEADGIFSFRIDFDQSCDPEQSLPDSFDFVLTSVPASKRNDAAVLSIRFARIQHFLERTVYRKHLFLSSIGVYPDQDGLYREDYDCIEAMSEKLLSAENFMRALSCTHVYRLGGLFGRDRIFAKYFSQRICTTGDQPANFIHIEDVLRLLQKGFENPLSHPVYNVVAPMHPLKKQVIIASSEKYHLAPPIAFEPNDTYQKIVCGDRIQEELNYHFIYSSPEDF